MPPSNGCALLLPAAWVLGQDYDEERKRRKQEGEAKEPRPRRKRWWEREARSRWEGNGGRNA